MDINSLHFLSFGLVAVLLCRILPGIRSRSAAVFCINLYFLSHFVGDFASALLLAAILCAIYLIGFARRHKYSMFTNAAVVIALLWGSLFLIKDPNLFGVVNPFHYFPVKIVGISYLVFRGISYLMEMELVERHSFADYLNYMLFFPMLLAGPIERFRDFDTQMQNPTEDLQDVWPALHRIANGFIKKFVLADNLSAFGMVSITQAPESSVALFWVGASLQLFLIYLDFSGYCDIMLGLARLMGIRLRENFNSPFLATNVQAFWDRWHMSLGQFLRDYVFNPLTKLVFQKFPRNQHSALIIGIYCLSMLLIALWHGTSLGFVIFGLVHAGALLAYQLKEKWRRKRKGSPIIADSFYLRLSNVVLMVVTYLFVSLSLLLWITVDGSPLKVYGKMLGVN